MRSSQCYCRNFRNMIVCRGQGVIILIYNIYRHYFNVIRVGVDTYMRHEFCWFVNLGCLDSLLWNNCICCDQSNTILNVIQVTLYLFQKNELFNTCISLGLARCLLVVTVWTVTQTRKVRTRARKATSTSVGTSVRTTL